MQIPVPLSAGYVRAVCSRLMPGAAAALALANAIAFTRPGLAQRPVTTAPPPTVIVEPARLRDVAEQDSFTGRVQAIDKAQIRTRVQGFIKSRGFEEGAEVAKDQVLFEIEREQFQAALDLAQANLASARAELELAEATFKRISTLEARGTASQAQLDSARSQRSKARARVQAQWAQVERARLDLSYTDIRAPLAGRVGRATYSVGELIGPSSEPLVTLVVEDPVYVAFPVPQRVMLAVQREGRTNESVTVEIKLPDDTTYDHRGAIKFADVAANPGADTVTVRATVPNPNRLLVDQELVGVTVIAKQPDRKLVVSQSAILLDQQGAYLLAVDKDNKVETRRIALGERRGPDVVVTSGLQVGERVIAIASRGCGRGSSSTCTNRRKQPRRPQAGARDNLPGARRLRVSARPRIRTAECGCADQAIAHPQLRTLRQTPPLQTRRTAQTGAQLRTLRQTPRLQTRRTAHATTVTGDSGRAAAPIAAVFVGAAAAEGVPITPAPVATSNALAITAILLPLAFMLALLCDEPGP